MTRRPLWIISAIAALVAAGLAFQQAAGNAPRELASLIPPGPLLVLEAKDFHSLLHEWNSSATKAAWLKSANYEVFSRSRLLQRLELSQTEFAAAAGLPPDMNLLESAAGAQSALALYDIGNLEFLYITRMPAEQFAATQLWKLRGSYQPRQSAGIAYYVKTDPATRHSAVFCATQGYVFLATREDALAGALALLGGQSAVAVNQEAWFVRSVQATGAKGELRLVMNLERLATTPHFRTYWIQRNNSAVKRFSAGISDLSRVAGDFHEDRVFLRASEQQPAWNESALNQAARFAPASAGFVQGWATPPPEQVWALVRSRVLAPEPVEQDAGNRAPQVNLTEGVAGDESDLEARIDLPPVDLSDPPEYQPLQRLLRSAPIEAVVQIRTTRLNGVFVGIESGIVLLAGADWDADAARNALSTALSSSWGIGAAGSLPDLGYVKLAISGRALLIATNKELLDAMLASQSSLLPAARYAALYRHSQELKNLTRVTTLIDAPNAVAAGGTEPPFFSRNLASLGETLSWVDSESVSVHESAADVRETVRYQVRK
jgi:hypothetical protein